MGVRISLAEFPILNQALSDSRFAIASRPVDNHWFYENIVPYAVSGFNPFHRRMYISQRSALGDWIQSGYSPGRKWNEGDYLVKESFFLVHDYLHAWTCALIQREVPEIQFGYGEITSENLDDLVFCHLLTEAAATVGLDYWTLGTIDFSAVVDCGSNHRHLAAAYREDEIEEYRRFSPDFVAQEPAFLARMAEFYCSGIFPGFTLTALKRSNKLRRWLEHELRYGEKQRGYTRAWFWHLAGKKGPLDSSQLTAPVPTSKPWQKRLLKQVGLLLWEKVKLGRDTKLPESNRETWRAPRRGIPNFRFTEYRKVKFKTRKKIQEGPNLAENFDYYFSQKVSSYEFDTFPKNLLPLLNYARENQDMPSLNALLKQSGAKQIPRAPDSPRDLLFLN